jgi:hypothetical protein
MYAENRSALNGRSTFKLYTVSRTFRTHRIRAVSNVAHSMTPPFCGTGDFDAFPFPNRGIFALGLVGYGCSGSRAIYRYMVYMVCMV